MNKTAFAPNFKAMRFDMVKLLVVSILWIPMVFISNKCSAQATPSRVLLALSKSDHNLAIINPLTLKVITRVPVGSDPHEVIASADGKTAYVSIYGGGSLHELSVIDLVAQKALPAIDTKPLMGPHGLTFAGGKVWFSAEGAKAVGRYDPATGKFDWAMGTGQDRTHMIYVTDDGKKVFTTNVSSATVSILEDSLLKPMGPPGGFAPPARHDWVQTVIPVAQGSEGFDVSPKGRELWTAGAEDGNISIIDITAKKVTATIDAKVTGANRLKFTPDGKRVLVTSLRTGDLFVFDATSHQEIKRINAGHGAAGILVDDDGSRAFIGCTGDNYVAVIDLNKLEVTGHIDIRGADGLAWALMP
ncbi:YVTN family beta-propeller protein [Mucilaginibacter sp. SG538B]|uniref:YncE family protein n=1 Tax=unclassified Mucilaginibacter TaxID=2617802 RepID=UPI000871579A|nr:MULTISPECIES: YncE family protein [unclassified Mucilaginibacter]NVM67169.1 YVTN family beta-propeller protein [Mucilaginibacter sp. SG538B]SCW81196.1 40-residue YVTN family beta-propeller repeat-containing protein [Mucilaginibacter sp. NFR10]